MRAWPILALTFAAAFILSLGALVAGPSFMRMCDGSITGIDTGDAVTICERMVGGARVATIVTGALLMGTLAIGLVTIAGHRATRSRDDRPLVSVRARKR